MKIKLATALTMITMIVLGWLFIDRTKADNSYVAKVEQYAVMVHQRVEIKINQDKIDTLRKEIREFKWCLEAEPDNKRCRDDLSEAEDTLIDELKKRERLYK